MTKLFGFELLHSQLVDHVSSEYGWTKEEAIGDTPIEKLFYTAVLMRCLFRSSEFVGILVAQDEDHETMLRQAYQTSMNRLIMRPQVQVGDFRVDFLFHVYEWNDANTFRPIIVECDGHEFHERTKEQAARDRRRDRSAVVNGIPLMRFTGSELWRDPWGCAAEFLDYCARDWGRS